MSAQKGNAHDEFTPPICSLFRCAAILLLGSLSSACYADADFSGSHQPDILWRNSTDNSYAAWVMNTDTGAITSSLALVNSYAVPAAWQVVGTPDLNGDGHPDLLWRNTQTGDLSVWYMNGNTYLSGAIIASGLSLDYQVVGTPDMNGDGKPDILFQQVSTGQLTVWYMNGATETGYSTFTGNTLPWKLVGAADLNGDGKSDLIWQNTQTGEVDYWLMNGVTQLSYGLISNPGTGWSVQGMVDLNGDGQPDVLLQTGGTVAVWYMNGTSVAGSATVASNIPSNYSVAGMQGNSAYALLIPPTNVVACATGSQKISLYWDRVPGATGYNIYRGTTSGGENYSAPINGTTPVTTLSYAGSQTYTYNDTSGLVDNTEYFYTVKAVNVNNVSLASDETSDAPNPGSVPWDTRNAGSILSAFRAAYANDEPALDTLQLVGPDGSIYDDTSNAAQPPNTNAHLADNAYDLSDGTTAALSPAGYGGMLANNTGIQNCPGAFGPLRRICSIPGYRAVKGDMLLAAPHVVSVLNGTKTGDTPELHLGSHTDKQSGAPVEVDAGLTYGSLGWGLYLRIASGRNNFYVGTPSKPGVQNPKDRAVAFLQGKLSSRFTNGQTVNMQFYGFTTRQDTVHNRTVNDALTLIAVNDAYDLNGTSVALGGHAFLNRSNLSSMVLKRVHAIAQVGNYSLPNFTKRTGSTWTGVAWGEADNQTTGGNGPGQLLPAAFGSSWQYWTANNTYGPGNPQQNNIKYLWDGAFVGYPTANATVTWTGDPVVPYRREYGININIYGP